MNTNENIPALTRRRFLATTALAGAGLVLAPRSLNAQNASVPSNRASGNAINIAVVGVGEQGKVLLNSINAIAKAGQIAVNLRAVCDIWPYQLKQNVRRERLNHPEVEGYSDIEDMLAKQKNLDALFVATPDFWHERHTVLGLKSGLHVYCEKMMARTADEARHMVRTAKETGKLLQIGHQRRSNPNYRYAYDIILKKFKLLGRITNANAQWNRALSKDLTMPRKDPVTADNLKRYGYDGPNEFRNWRWFKKYSNGPISDLGAHQIDIFNWVFGRPYSVIAAGGVDYYESHEWYDNVMCIFDYKDPEAEGRFNRAYYQVLTTTSSGGGYFENFMGIDGSLKLSEVPKHIKLYAEGVNPKVKEHYDAFAEKKILFPDKTPPPVVPKDGIADARSEASPKVAAYDLPSKLGKKYIHQPHVENFFQTIRGDKGVSLTCDGAHAFESEASIFRVNEAVEAQKRIIYTDADFAV